MSDTGPKTESLRPILLDTSAALKLGGATIEALSKITSLYISPLAVWELASNLDTREWGAYSRSIMRLRHCSVLHDPFAELGMEMGIAHHIPASRFDDRALALEVIAAVQASDTFADLTARTVLANGRPFELANLAQFSRQALALEEDKYRTDMLKWMDAIPNLVPNVTKANLTAAQLFDFVRGASKQVLILSAGQGVPDPAAEAKAFQKTYFFLAYTIQRALEYLRRANGGRNQTAIDGNDFEDGANAISRHNVWERHSRD